MSAFENRSRNWKREDNRQGLEKTSAVRVGAIDYAKRRNLNRGYMKLEVWQRGMDLFELASRLVDGLSDLKLKSQFADAVQSVSANIAEGYGRRSLPEYLQFLYTAKGSLAESLTRAVGLSRARIISPGDFEQFDKLHYEVENKFLGLISSLESKQESDSWNTKLLVPNANIQASGLKRSAPPAAYARSFRSNRPAP